MNLEQCREEINKIDENIVKLYCERMEIADRIGEYKKENGLPVYDAARERQLIDKVIELAGEENENGIYALYSLLMDISRSRQQKIVYKPTKLSETLDKAIENTDQLFPSKAVVACQGTDGAYSQTAAQKIFKHPSLMFFSSFESVFSAVDKGLCRYGVLPLENSTAGSVKQIYDLMLKYDFSIVRTTRIQVSHVLAAKHGASFEGIKQIYSHEQAILQSNEFLGSLKNIKIIPCENTAFAAQKVMESGRMDVAAICSGECAASYGLEILKTGIADETNNYTRFICISKKPEIYPGADKTSIMMTLPHRAGSLYKVLSKLYVLGINLNKLESRPIPDRNFEFMFYFDIDESIYSPALRLLLCDLEHEAPVFKYLGSYSEVI
ncbi:MAG: chorismate mutase [Firmicutes bacterium]|nr:chorismate mutase [Bacillota bacterium]